MAGKKRRTTGKGDASETRAAPQAPGPPDVPLAAYRRKRDFDRTAEPRGAETAEPAASAPSGRSFVVQKHAARQLHYDLRLEVDGVLRSWAVPRGPSLDPAQKPLAVHTEDHPLEYGSFEGVIPEGEYGGGTVMLWDCGEWEPLADPDEGYEKGDLKFRLHGEKLRGDWVLARMADKPGKAATEGEPGRNWLLIKKQDAEARKLDVYNVLAELPFSVASGRTMEQIAASPEAVWTDGGALRLDDDGRGQARAPGAGGEAVDPSGLAGARKADLPATFKPQLCETAPRPPAGDDWLHEVKLDGYRLLCRIDGDDVRLLTRNGHDWTDRFPAVARAARRLGLSSAILDGEVVVLDAKGVADFGALQSAFRGHARGAFTYFVFDAPHALGHDLTRVPLLQRKEYLGRLVEGAPSAAPTIQLCPHFVGNGAVVFAQAAKFGLEGIVSKRIAAPYVSRRADTWLKVRAALRQEFVVGGFMGLGGGATGVGSLLLGCHDSERGGLVYCGRVGSGFTDQTRAMLDERLRARLVDAPPFLDPERDPDVKKAQWVRPDLVADVEFTSWTKEGVVRHPVYRGLRDDLDPSEVVREATPGERLREAVSDEDAPEPSPSRTRTRPTAAPDAATVAGVRISNPRRTVYPEARVSKLEVARFYDEISAWILPHVAKRPLSLVRCPLGLAGEAFYQRHLAAGFPAPLRGVPPDVEIDGEPYLVVDDLTGLITLVQMGVLEIHTWGCRENDLEKPDQIVFDLDPGPGIEWEHLVASACFVRDYLDEVGLRSFVKTSGGKGIHVVVPVIRRAGWPRIKEFAHAVAVRIVRRAPRNFVATMAKSQREHRVYVDYLRNTRGATAVAPYSTRARPGAHVSTPLAWDELSPDLPPSRYTVKTVPGRLAELVEDPWQDFRSLRQSITQGIMQKVKDT